MPSNGLLGADLAGNLERGFATATDEELRPVTEGYSHNRSPSCSGMRWPCALTDR